MSTTKTKFWGGDYGCWQLIWVPRDLPAPHGLIDDWPYSTDGLAIIQRARIRARLFTMPMVHGSGLGIGFRLNKRGP